MKRCLACLIVILVVVSCGGSKPPYAKILETPTLNSDVDISVDFNEAIDELGEDEPLSGYYKGVTFKNFLLGGVGKIRTIVPSVSVENLDPIIQIHDEIESVEIRIRSRSDVRMVGKLNGEGVIDVFITGQSSLDVPGLYYSFNGTPIDEVVFLLEPLGNTETIEERILVIDTFRGDA